MTESRFLKYRDNARDVFFLTGSQEGILYECKKDPDSLAYNSAFEARFKKTSGIEAERLIQAIKKAAESCPACHAAIESREEGNVMLRQSPMQPEVPLIKLSSPEELPAHMDHFVRRFPLEEGRLARFEIVELPQEYVFLMDFHHIVFDGLSFDHFLNLVAAFYNGDALPEEGTTLFDYAAYEEHKKDYEDYEESRRYFTKMLDGLDVDSNVIFDKEPKDGKSGACGIVKIRMDEVLSKEELLAFKSEHGISESSFFMGVTAYALAMASGQEEAYYCAVNHGRRDETMRHSVGMFVRTLPVYVRIDQEKKSAEMLSLLQEEFYMSMRHNDYSFSEMAAECGVRADILFAYEGESMQGFTLGDVMVPLEKMPDVKAQGNLCFMIYRRGDGYILDLKYDEALYEQDTIRRFSRLFQKIAAGMLKNERLKDIELVDEEDLKALETFNDLDVSGGEEETVLSLFERQAGRCPDAPAIVYEDRTLTYRELSELSDGLAGYLQEIGVRKGEPVGIMIDRSEWMTVCALGVSKTGAFYQPLDVTYPEERLTYMAQDSGIRYLVMDREYDGLLEGYEGVCVYTDQIPTYRGKYMRQEVDVRPEDAFIILYTSGTTGKPKGCVLEHGNLADFCRRHREYCEIGEQDHVMAYASFGFDASMMDVYPCLFAGGCVYILPESLRLDLPGIHQFMLDHQITISFMTTQLGTQYVTEYPDNPFLKCFLLGGEKLRSCDPPSYPFFNVYGPTETTILTTHYKVTKREKNIPIGKASVNTKLYIADKYMRLLPVKIPGELCIAGPLVSRGYLNQPEMTDKKYVKNPFCEEEKYNRMYLSGDVCRYLPDGNIEFVGRKDAQVKIRGFRIELSEIENCIRLFEGVRNAAVIAKDSPSGIKQIYAYVVGDREIDVSRLKQFMADSLPAYMIPSAMMQIPEIPLTVNGKLNKKNLPEIKVQAVEEESGRLNCLEEELKAMVADILGDDRFGIHTNFSEIGLSSLSTIRLATKVAERFDYHVDVKKLLADGTVFALEEELIREKILSEEAAKRNAGNRTEEKSAQKHGDGDENRVLWPLSKAQQGVYLDCMKDPESSMYHIPMMLTFPEGTKPEEICAAIEGVIPYHPAIGACLVMEEGVPMQKDAGLRAPIERFELSDEAFEQLKADFMQPFDLFAGPLYRIAIVQTARQVRLLMNIHHIIIDGGSLDLFLRQIVEWMEGKTPAQEEFTAFEQALEESRERESAAFKEAEAFFDTALRDFEEATEIPADLSGIEEKGELKEAVVPIRLEQVKAFCKQNRFTPAQLFYAGCSYAVSRYASSPNVYISTISSGRTDLRLRNSAGMFVRTLVLALAQEKKETVLEYIRRAGQQFEKTLEYEQYSLTDVAERYRYRPRVMYACQLGVMDKLMLGGQEVKEEGLTLSKPKFRISIHIEEQKGGPVVSVQYNDALYSAAYMEQFATSIVQATEKMMENPELEAGRISLLTDEDRRTLDRFNKGLEVPVAFDTIPEMFADAVLKNPDTEALVACDRTYTYREMDKATNHVANALIARQVEQGACVVVLLPRRSCQLIAIYGILKAGCAYIPCDPEYPKERISHIVEDSGAAAIVTTSDKCDEYRDHTVYDIEELLAPNLTPGQPEGSTKDWDQAPEVSISGSDLAYLIYTSGSTGKPKGVMIAHKGLCNYVQANEGSPHISSFVKDAGRMVSVTTVSFDMSLKETAVTLLNGRTLILADEEQANNPVLLAKLIAEKKGDAFNATPSRMMQYMELPEFCSALSDCKVIMAGGEKYPPELLKKLKKHTKARLFNTYGPTEITVSCNAKELTGEDLVSVGKPLSNYVEYIVDSDGNELPPGVVGELYVGGIGVAKGYRNLPEMTKERFIEYQGKTVYKTGDYAKWTPDGDVIILGRTDHQVKIRGLRIELGEVEKSVLSFPGMNRVIVCIRKVQNEECLCAYYTAERPIDVEELKTYLGERLTAYMIPDVYTQLEQFVLTPNGKVDFGELPMPERHAKAEGYAAPENETQRDFCEIFEKILGVEKISITDNFFENGGSSLTATRIIIEAVKKNYEITYGDVFSHPTPKALASMFTENREGESGLPDLSAYDYQAFDSILKENDLDHFVDAPMHPLGDIAITGATGFLGIHILDAFLKNQTGKAYCLVRGKKDAPAYQRLMHMLFYYFDEDYEEKYKGRIIVHDGDVTRADSIERLKDYPIDTIFNCAANVKHFSEGTDIEDVNVGGVENLVAFCLRNHIRLVHVSTTSVSGFSIGNVPPEDTVMDEQMLYFGQNLDTKYGHSKFLAERLILENIPNGLKAKIMRVGNLSARDADGEFQINASSNSFMGRLKSYALIGGFPYSSMEQKTELAPIDYTARAILLLSESPDACVIFHPYNNHSIPLGELIIGMKQHGMEIELQEDAAFDEMLKKAKENPENAAILSSMIAYQNMGHGKRAVPIQKRNSYTMQVLYRLGFQWPIPSQQYEERFLSALEGLNYFL